MYNAYGSAYVMDGRDADVYLRPYQEEAEAAAGAITATMEKLDFAKLIKEVGGRALAAKSSCGLGAGWVLARAVNGVMRHRAGGHGTPQLGLFEVDAVLSKAVLVPKQAAPLFRNAVPACLLPSRLMRGTAHGASPASCCSVPTTPSLTSPPHLSSSSPSAPT